MLMQIGSIQKVPDFIKRVKTGEVKLMGFGHRVYKNYDPRARIIKHRLRSLRTHGQEPAPRNRSRVRAHRSRRRILREAQALTKRGLLHWAHLPIDGFPDDHVSRPLRDSAHFRLDRAVGRDAPRPRAENCAPTADLSGARYASLRSDRSAELRNTLRDVLDNPMPSRIVIL